VEQEQRALVTGADGLLGSYLVRELIDAGHDVRALVQPNSTARTLDGLCADRLERQVGDLTDDAALARAVEGCAFVLHCAAIADPFADPARLWRINVEATRQLLEHCVAHHVQRFVFVGSASSYAFGSKDRPGDEGGDFPDAYRGIAYMEYKHEATLLVREFVAHRGLDAVIVVPTFMLGYYDSRPSSGELVRQFIKRPLPFSSRGGRNFVHARDVARAMVAALDKGRRGEAYIVGGENLSYRDFFAKVAAVTHQRAPRVVLPHALVMATGAAGSLVGAVTGKRPALTYEVARLSGMSTFYRSDKARAELGIAPTPIDTAIADSVRGLRDHGHIQ